MDVVCDPEGSRMLYKNAGSTDKTLHVYPEMWHQLVGEPAEGVEKVFGDMFKWLDARLPPQGDAISGWGSWVQACSAYFKHYKVTSWEPSPSPSMIEVHTSPWSKSIHQVHERSVYCLYLRSYAVHIIMVMSSTRCSSRWIRSLQSVHVTWNISGLWRLEATPLGFFWSMYALFLRYRTSWNTNPQVLQNCVSDSLFAWPIVH